MSMKMNIFIEEVLNLHCKYDFLSFLNLVFNLFMLGTTKLKYCDFSEIS